MDRMDVTHHAKMAYDLVYCSR